MIYPLKSSDARYTLFLRDFLGLADPRSLLTGIGLFNILDENLVGHIYQTMNGIDETIYNGNIPSFLDSCRGFI